MKRYIYRYIFYTFCRTKTDRKKILVIYTFKENLAILLNLRAKLGTLSKDDDDGSENVGKKMNLPSFKLNRVYLDPLNRAIYRRKIRRVLHRTCLE